MNTGDLSTIQFGSGHAEILSLATSAGSLPAAASPADFGHTLPIAAIAPFVLLLIAIATMPLFAKEFWEHNRNKALISGLLALPFAIWLVVVHGSEGTRALLDSGRDYLSFMALLGSLYVISGGIHVRGSLAGTPLSNTAMLGIGAVLSNFIGTTGASMVLIRPLLRANRTREETAHSVVFFIFVVSNCGGLLTPLGDPPLFLGFLKGVPFGWTLSLWPQWLAVNGMLLVIYNFVDSYIFEQEEERRPGSQLEEALKHEPIRIDGAQNLLILAGIVLVIVAKGEGLFSASGHWVFGVQEILMLALGATSYFSTTRSVHVSNRFRFAPIVEVAVLFGGIFVTMAVPLEILNARGGELGMKGPMHYFWAVGALSSFLDNAPTYLALAATAAGQAGISVGGPRYLAEFLARGPEAVHILSAIACGAVMMGANTYIGNGPNFMVKAIAEDHGVEMPSFFGYMVWSGLILLPTFAVVTYFFFNS